VAGSSVKEIEMFGRRLSLAVCATIAGATFTFAQAPPDKSTQGSGLQQPGTAPSTPSVPSAPALQQAPGLPAQTQTPAQPQGQTLPGHPPATPNAQPTQVQPGQPGQPQVGQPQPGQIPSQPRSIDNNQPNQNTPPNREQNRDQAQQSDDAQFVVKAGECDLAEINIGRLAQQRASRQDIRQFAAQLVQDHSTHLNQLNELANRNRWKGAERMDQEHQQLFQKLAAMQGQEFDRMFVSKMVEGHKKVIGMYTHASQNCQHAELKNFANQTLPVIRQHEQIAQRLQGQNPQAQPTQSPTSGERNANPTDENGVEPSRPESSRVIGEPAANRRANEPQESRPQDR